jgi:hypothetical protein
MELVLAMLCVRAVFKVTRALMKIYAGRGGKKIKVCMCWCGRGCAWTLR